MIPSSGVARDTADGEGPQRASASVAYLCAEGARREHGAPAHGARAAPAHGARAAPARDLRL